MLRHGGVGFAVVHNHPSGNCEPSAEDVAVTQRLEQAASAAGLKFLDHLVTGVATGGVEGLTKVDARRLAGL